MSCMIGATYIAIACKLLSYYHCFHQSLVSKMTSYQIQSEECTMKNITVVDGNIVGYSIRVKHNTCCMTRYIQGQDSLGGYIDCWSAESLKHAWGHLPSVGLWVKRNLCQQYWALFWCNTEFIIEKWYQMQIINHLKYAQLIHKRTFPYHPSW